MDVWLVIRPCLHPPYSARKAALTGAILWWQRHRRISDGMPGRNHLEIGRRASALATVSSPAREFVLEAC
jgi:hypothetical protein